MSTIAEMKPGYEAVAKHEGAQSYTATVKRERIRLYEGHHLAKWKAAAEAEDITEPCPLARIVENWKAELKAGPQSVTPAVPAPTKPQAPAAKPEGTADPGSTNAEEGESSTALLPKGQGWLESHARIVESEVPEVKSHAADPDDSLAAKAAFVERNLPILWQYVKNPAKAPSPLFAWVALYLGDTGRTDDALRICNEAVRLRQPSTMKRDFHAMAWDFDFERLTRIAEEVAQSKEGFPRFMELRDRLMKSKFRGNHNKAEVCKLTGIVALAVGEYEIAKRNLLSVKVLDPHMGVETLLAKVEGALSEESGADNEPSEAPLAGRSGDEADSEPFKDE